MKGRESQRRTMLKKTLYILLVVFIMGFITWTVWSKIISDESLKRISTLVPIFTLVFLAIYVWKTWDMASATRSSVEEMREDRNQRVSPYVVIYFEVNISRAIIDIVIKNVGAGVARDINFEFDQPIKNSEGTDFAELPMFKDGIKFFPPNYEERIFFDTAIRYLQQDLPLKYHLKLSYRGGLDNSIRTEEQVLDLSRYKDVSQIRIKTVHDLVKSVDKLTKQVEKVHKEIDQLAQYRKGKELSAQIGDVTISRENLDRIDRYGMQGVRISGKVLEDRDTPLLLKLREMKGTTQFLKGTINEILKVQELNLHSSTSSDGKRITRFDCLLSYVLDDQKDE